MTRTRMAAVGLPMLWACTAQAPELEPLALLEIRRGEDQTAEAGQVLADPVWVSLRTVDGPVSLKPITLTVRSGDGFIAIPGRVGVSGNGGSIDELTGRDGIAEFFPGVSVTPGRHEFVATADIPVSNSMELIVVATGIAGPVANVGQGGDAQTGPSGEFLPLSLTVTLTDQFGNPRSDEAVRWTVTGGGGAVTDSVSTSDAAGIASVQWRLGSAGPQTLEATIGALAPAEFTATAQ